MFNQIIVAFDGSDHAESAVRAACDIAGRYNAKLHVVHVPQLYDEAFAVGYATVTLPVSTETIQESGASMIARAEEIAKEEGKTFASTNILSGPPGDAILSCARDKDADLVILGRRGLGSLRGVLMGSVSQNLAAHADCAVMTVK
ncbi:universal stress protein [Flavimaricola marinus]|uniref:Stress response protein NhaX n=1 Tax=Flavimaricola marinus TaxID=1819565 RepID=A0A238LBS3_9RHOB|nr:universal stress protein [Flavimaricola marinus]SMY07022.1 Stress response protein NhaX [Flavimaricola marinus]